MCVFLCVSVPVCVCVFLCVFLCVHALLARPLTHAPPQPRAQPALPVPGALGQHLALVVDVLVLVDLALHVRVRV